MFQVEANTDWLAAKHVLMVSAGVYPLKRFKTGSAAICYHDYRTIGLFLGVWELLYSQSLKN